MSKLISRIKAFFARLFRRSKPSTPTGSVGGSKIGEHPNQQAR